LFLVTTRYSRTLQFGDSNNSADGVNLEKNAGPSPLGAWLSELNLKPTITLEHEKRGVWVLEPINKNT
jgi:hypothetical protein